MDVLILGGALVTLCGVALLLISIRRVVIARKTGDEGALKEALQKAAGLNMIALFSSVLGLSAVIVAILFGG